MKKTNKIIKIVSFIILIIAPFLSLIIVNESIDNQFSETYLAEFNDKYDLLKSTDEKKIIFVGGSSLPFGLRSDLIEKEISGYKVVNFGLYATLGTKFMMDMSKVNISSGDIVILSPELNEQTYSLYFNPEAILQACDGFAMKQKLLSFQDNMKLFYNYFDFATEKIKYSINGNSPDPIGIYRHDSFNEYGDIEVERPYNIMNNGVDGTMLIETSDSLMNKDFIEYVNDYCDYVRKKKAKIYFNFSPCNELALNSSKESRLKFQQELDELINCDLLLNLDDCIIDYRYFYDTNFHLNSSGAIYYSSLLIKGIKQKLNMSVTNEETEGDGDNSDIVVPIPTIKDDDVIEPDESESLTDFDDYNGEPNNDYQDYFNYRLVGSSYQIISVKDEYKNVKKLILPSTYNGRNITTIVGNALYGCVELEEVYIGLTYRTFEENSFNGCISLEKIYFFAMDGNTLSPASSGLINGCSKNIKIYIPSGSNYISGYTWMNYSNYFIYFSRGGE